MAAKPRFDGEWVKFSSAFVEVSRGVTRFKQKDYRESGLHPIIDQGKDCIAGYSDEESGLFVDVPAIVFGDHTRCFKYVDEPFFIGADGVKIIKPKLSDDVRFWWHSLRAVPLEDLGYSRHFKLLKESSFRNFNANDQALIRQVLDDVLEQIGQAYLQLSRLDALVKSRFVEMFDGKGYPTSSVSTLVSSMRNGLSPSKSGSYRSKVLTLSAITQGRFDPLAWKEGFFSEEPPANKRVSDEDFYICRGNGNIHLVGTGEYSSVSMEDAVFPDTMIALKLKRERIILPFLRCAWNQISTRKQIEASAKTTNGTFKINQAALGNIELPVPPLELQLEFADFVAEVDKSRFVVQQQIEKLQMLYDSLAQEYFS